MINLNDNEKKWVLKRLKEVSERQPSNYISGMYIKGVQCLKEQYENWQNGNKIDDEATFEQELKNFIDIEIKNIALNKVR